MLFPLQTLAIDFFSLVCGVVHSVCTSSYATFALDLQLPKNTESQKNEKVSVKKKCSLGRG